MDEENFWFVQKCLCGWFSRRARCVTEVSATWVQFDFNGPSFVKFRGEAFELCSNFWKLLSKNSSLIFVTFVIARNGSTTWSLSPKVLAFFSSRDLILFFWDWICPISVGWGEPGETTLCSTISAHSRSCFTGYWLGSVFDEFSSVFVDLLLQRSRLLIFATFHDNPKMYRLCKTLWK